jgi:hypothetical protein
MITILIGNQTRLICKTSNTNHNELGIILVECTDERAKRHVLILIRVVIFSKRYDLCSYSR